MKLKERGKKIVLKTRAYLRLTLILGFLLLVFNAQSHEYLRHLVVDFTPNEPLKPSGKPNYDELAPQIRVLITEIRVHVSSLSPRQEKPECRSLIIYLNDLERSLIERFREVKSSQILDLGPRIGDQLNPLLQFGNDNCEKRMEPLWGLQFGQKDGFFTAPFIKVLGDSLKTVNFSELSFGNRGSIGDYKSARVKWFLKGGIASDLKGIHLPFYGDTKAFLPLSSVSALLPSVKLEVNPNFGEPMYQEKVQTDYQITYGLEFLTRQLSAPIKIDFRVRQGFATGGLYNHNFLSFDFTQELGESGLERLHSINMHFEKRFSSDESRVRGFQQTSVSYLLEGQTYAGGDGRLEIGFAESRTQDRKVDLSQFASFKLNGKYFYENIFGLSTLPSVDVYAQVSPRFYETLVREYSIKPRLLGRIYGGQAQIAMGLWHKLERPVSGDILGSDFQLSSTSLSFETRVLFSKQWTLDAELDFGLRKYSGPALETLPAGVRHAALRDGFYYTAGLGVNYVF